MAVSEFLSTPSARRATPSRPPHRRSPAISIHALREEGDNYGSEGDRTAYHFYPRPPRGGRPGLRCHLPGRRRISIHALREEGDNKATHAHHPAGVFLSTPSARRATSAAVDAHNGAEFLSTPSARRATNHAGPFVCPEAISIHALREEGDYIAAVSLPMLFYFYPRPPRGGRQQKQRQNLYFQTNYTTFCTNLEEP